MKRIILLSLFLAVSISARVIPVNSTNLAANSKLSNGDTVMLGRLMYIDSGVTLSLDSGVVFKAAPGAGLVVCKGAKLVALGTKTKPIIFTSQADSMKPVRNITDTEIPDSGLWYGITILGKARVKTPNNIYYALDTNCYFQQTQRMAKTTYGGTNDQDSSGVLRYVSIRYAGTQRYYNGMNREPLDEIDDKLEFCGLALCGVGSKTVIDHVEAYACLDDGIKVYGGSVNIRYGVGALCQDNAFDFDEGYRGSAQFLLGIVPVFDYLRKEPTDHAAIRIEQMDGIDSSAIPSFANVTIIGTSSVANSIVSPSWKINFINGIIYSCGIVAFRYNPRPFIANNLFRESAFAQNTWKDFANSDSEKVYLMDHYNDILSKSNAGSHDLLMGHNYKDGPVKKFDPRPWDSLAVLYGIPNDTLKNPFMVNTLPNIRDTIWRGAFDPYVDSIWIQTWTALDYHGYLMNPLPKTRFSTRPKEPPVASNLSHASLQDVSMVLRLTSAGQSIIMSLPGTVSSAQVDFYTITGKRVRRLHVEASGKTAIPLTTAGLANGVYLCRVATAAGSGSFRVNVRR